MNYRSMAKSASRRRQTLQAKVSSTKADLAAMEKELGVLDGILKAIPSGAMKAGPGRPRGRKQRRKGGKWKKGHPGRPPKWYLAKKKAKGKPAKAAKAAKAARATKPAKKPVKKARKKRTVTANQLAGLARARATLAAKRLAAATSPPATP